MVKKGKNVPADHDLLALPQDDALFEALGKSKKRKKRKILIAVVSVVLVAAILGVIGIGFLRQKVDDRYGSDIAEVLSYEVNTGSISTVVSGSGNLQDVDLQKITVPEGVQITKVEVKVNQSVEEGDILARVNMASVVSAMAELQAQIQELDAQISNAESDAADTAVYAGVSGRVKVIYGRAGDDVVQVMYENGALALLSLDGYMAVDIQTDALLSGDAVTVTLSDGITQTGSVESVVGGVATVLITDNGTVDGDAVTVSDSNGTQLGTGELYVHSPLRVTGYTGTISKVNGSENSKVNDTTRLFTLKDTAYSANYSSLLRSRAELEETLLELLTIQRDGAVLSKITGSLASVDYTEGGTDLVTLSKDEKMSVTVTVDEEDILSLKVGQPVTVTVSSVSDSGFTGTLTEVDRSGSSGAYTAVVELEKTEGMLAGMSANVSVRIQGVDDAILIPVEALHKTGDGAYVYTSYNEKLQEYGGRVDVVTGIENSTYVEIKSGLQVGDTVYYTEQETVDNSFGNMPGGMGNFGGGEIPGFEGGEIPDFGGGDFNGGDFGGGSFPGGNLPGGSMPGGRGGN